MNPSKRGLGAWALDDRSLGTGRSGTESGSAWGRQTPSGAFVHQRPALALVAVPAAHGGTVDIPVAELTGSRVVWWREGTLDVRVAPVER